VSNLLNRAETHLSTKNTYEKEIDLIKDVLEGNKYSRKLIDNIINIRSKDAPKTEESKPVGTLVLSYIASLSEKNQLNCEMSKYSNSVFC
jgi:uncharacterized protein (UPF0335 family)